ncbi:hypothetical protein FKM82_029570 [Ascaphus truei]
MWPRAPPDKAGHKLESEIPATPLDDEPEPLEANDETILETTQDRTAGEETVNDTVEDPMEGPSQNQAAPPGGATSKGPRCTTPTRVAPMSQPLDPRSLCFLPQMDYSGTFIPSMGEAEPQDYVHYSPEGTRASPKPKNEVPSQSGSLRFIWGTPL